MSNDLITASWAVPMPSAEKLVLIYLADRANDAGETWPAVSTIAKATGCSIRTVHRSLTALKKGGHISWTDWRGKSSRYRVHPCHHDIPTSATMAEVMDVQEVDPCHHDIGGMPPCQGGSATMTEGVCHGDIQSSIEPFIEPQGEPSSLPAVAGEPILTPDIVFDAWDLLMVHIDREPSQRRTPKRIKAAAAILREYSPAELVRAFENIATSAWLSTSNVLSFDWVMKPDNFLNILEGKYTDRMNPREAGDGFTRYLRKWSRELGLADDECVIPF